MVVRECREGFHEGLRGGVCGESLRPQRVGRRKPFLNDLCFVRALRRYKTEPFTSLDALAGPGVPGLDL